MRSLPLGLMVVGLVLFAACGSDAGETDAASTTGRPVVDVAERSREAYNRCMVDHGGTVGPDGIRIDFADDDPAAMSEALADCAPFLPEPVELTDAEVRATYDRWLEEAECLRGLGYDPDPAPTFETFLADWRGTGPWDPLQGVDTASWTPAIAQAAKDACGLEFFDLG